MVLNLLRLHVSLYLELLRFLSWKTETLCNVIACLYDVICQFFDVKSADNRYVACLHRKLLFVLILSSKSLVRFISLEEIYLSRQKHNNRFYYFDKSKYFPVKHVI